jgi:hypothetical protein
MTNLPKCANRACTAHSPKKTQNCAVGGDLTLCESYEAAEADAEPDPTTPKRVEIGRIDENGYLHYGVNSANARYCPFAAGDIRCGIWCTLFGEPGYEDGYVELHICHDKVFMFDEFTDERHQ